MLVPIFSCDGLVGDVWLLGVVLWVSVWLSGAGRGGRLRDELRVNGRLAGDGLVRGHDGLWPRVEGIAKEMEQVGEKGTENPETMLPVGVKEKTPAATAGFTTLEARG